MVLSILWAIKTAPVFTINSIIVFDYEQLTVVVPQELGMNQLNPKAIGSAWDFTAWISVFVFSILETRQEIEDLSYTSSFLVGQRIDEYGMDEGKQCQLLSMSRYTMNMVKLKGMMVVLWKVTNIVKRELRCFFPLCCISYLQVPISQRLSIWTFQKWES